MPNGANLLADLTGFRDAGPERRGGSEDAVCWARPRRTLGVFQKGAATKEDGLTGDGEVPRSGSPKLVVDRRLVVAAAKGSTSRARKVCGEVRPLSGHSRCCLLPRTRTRVSALAAVSLCNAAHHLQPSSQALLRGLSACASSALCNRLQIAAHGVRADNGCSERLTELPWIGCLVLGSSRPKPCRRLRCALPPLPSKIPKHPHNPHTTPSPDLSIISTCRHRHADLYRRSPRPLNSIA